MIIGTLGRLGKGKTLTMVIEAYRDYCLGRQVFSNIWLKFPHIALKTPYDFIDIIDGFALLDELWALADNRRSMSLLNDIITIICIRSRRKKFDIGYTQQYVQIDPRIRFITDFWIRPKTFPDHLTGLTPQVLFQDVYDGDWRRMTPRQIDVKPYLNLYDTNLDPYTLAASVNDKTLKEALGRALDKDPSLAEDMEKLKQESLKNKEKKKPKTL